ncbi:MAG: amino acid ABC transporter permease [Eubacteriales bacterium]|nr:amino acid ABC transporter permease [Eubacteriales bacterium]MDD4391120.1 amino acid ABC transporter permease [Eubacteriales bacterium]
MGLYLDGFLVALKGAPVTIGVSLVAVALGVCLGLGIALMKMSKHWILRIPATIYVEIVRGTPIIVQAFIFAYGVPQLLQANGMDFRWSHLIIPAVIVCSLNSAAYVAEVIRSGLQAVDKGQMEAARSLGMSHTMSMRLIMIPQAFRIILPALGNEFVTLIKETSVLSFVGVIEIMRKGTLWNAATFETFPAYIGVAVAYMILTIPLSRFVSYVEKRMATDKKDDAKKSPGSKPGEKAVVIPKRKASV